MGRPKTPFYETPYFGYSDFEVELTTRLFEDLQIYHLNLAPVF